MQNYGSHKPFGSLADLVKSKKRAKRLCVGCGAGIQSLGGAKRCGACSAVKYEESMRAASKRRRQKLKAQQVKQND